jgi:hypothetical protein
MFRESKEKMTSFGKDVIFSGKCLNRDSQDYMISGFLDHFFLNPENPLILVVNPEIR